MHSSLSPKKANSLVHAEQDASTPRYSIGQVLQILIADYPGLSSSKIRFLEDMNLVSPQRTPSGYRKYSQRDVDRIGVILRLQRDRYMPLKVIAKHLDELDEAWKEQEARLTQTGRYPHAETAIPAANPTGSSTANLTAGSTTNATTTPAKSAPASSLQTLFSHSPLQEYNLGQLLSASGVSKDLLERAISAGFLSRASYYSRCDVDLLQALDTLERYGIYIRHLKPFKTVAQHEVALIESALGGKNRARHNLPHMHKIAENIENILRALLLNGLR